MLFFKILWISLASYAAEYSCSTTNTSLGDVVEIRRDNLTVKTYVHKCELYKGPNKPKQTYLLLSEQSKESFQCPLSGEFERYPGGHLYEGAEPGFTPTGQ